MKFFIFVALFSFLLTGCGKLFYLSQLGWHQACITFHSLPIQEILEDETLEKKAKEKILFIQEVKRYGEEKLGLRRTKNYSRYFKTQSPVLYVLTVAEKDRLHLYQWDFPMIGKVTYKSFFTQEGVLKEKSFFEKREYDTFVQEVEAYSTLGWLKDPIFSSMLQWDEVILTHLILHEMAHTTFYFRNQTDINEQIATFIGNQGSINFLIEKYGRESPQVTKAVHLQKDEILFSHWVEKACQSLSDLYTRGISRAEKLMAREALFQSIKEEFKEIQSQLMTECYRGFDKLEINNAVLLAYRRYFYRLEYFYHLYEYSKYDLKKVIDLLKRLKESGNIPLFPSAGVSHQPLTIRRSYISGYRCIHKDTCCNVSLGRVLAERVDLNSQSHLRG